MRFKIIKSTILKIPFVKHLNKLEQGDFSITGNVEIYIDGLSSPLPFDFKIEKEYPLKSYDSESIKFSNIDLLPFSHVMGDGHICIHTSHSTNIEDKIRIDFYALKDWIIKYYIKKEEDINYEHIIVNDSEINNSKYSFHFTETNKSFKKDEIGTVKLSDLDEGLYKDKRIFNYYVQTFEPLQTSDIKRCQWSNYYHKQKVSLEGIYYFLETSPSIYNKFAYTNWDQLNFQASFLKLLFNVEQENLKKNRGKMIPLFIGYNINSNEIHWQVALLEVGKFPLKGVAEKIDDIKTGKWLTAIKKSEIKWGISRNTSYKYFFGRGIFSEKLTNRKILIIGIGAIGSIVAKTLTQCGCKNIDFIDHDIKEPENICRSEYRFANGITNKTTELEKILFEISPFINSTRLNNNYFEKLIKSFYSDSAYHNKFKEDLENYDLIIDCSTDNDLMYVLNSLKLNIELLNISITNHARELVFAFYPNIYRFVNNQFSNILKNDILDLYEPTGCWSPTFKASYNDIAVIVQLALKHFNKIEKGEVAKNNFVIQELGNNYKIIEY